MKENKKQHTIEDQVTDILYYQSFLDEVYLKAGFTKDELNAMKQRKSIRVPKSYNCFYQE